MSEQKKAVAVLIETFRDCLHRGKQPKFSAGDLKYFIEALIAQPADQQGDPIGWTTPGMLAIAKDVDGPHSRFGARTNRSTRFCVPLYLHAQPATAKVDELSEFSAWKGYPLPELNADGQFDKEYLQREWVSWQARAKLNGGQS